MKRFISTLCLLVGASVASYAGVITSTAGTGLLGANGYLQTFDSGVVGSFPLASFTSTSFAPNTSPVNVTVSSSAPGAGGLPNNASTKNTGGTASLRTGVAGFGANDAVISSQGFCDATLSSCFARNLTFTFSSPVSEFLISYFGNDSGNNYFLVNGVTQYSLGTSVNGQIGANNEGPINSVTFVIFGNDSTAGTLGGADGGDRVLFNDLRITAGAATSGGSGSSSSSGNTGGGSAVPEPSTYAMLGAGLMAIAYARRKK